MVIKGVAHSYCVSPSPRPQRFLLPVGRQGNGERYPSLYLKILAPKMSHIPSQWSHSIAQRCHTLTTRREKVETLTRQLPLSNHSVSCKEDTSLELPISTKELPSNSYQGYFLLTETLETKIGRSLTLQTPQNGHPASARSS